jgi:hypothetical protein|tara:strand:- start:4850 stop:6253 length:1404 start_codon:yes stop_codon:yes gene_type:complete
MGLRTWLARGIGGAALTQEIEAAEAFSPISSQGIDPDEHLWRRAGRVDRALPPHKQAQSGETAFYLYKTNPLARRIINLAVDYVVGDEVTILADDPDTQRVIDRFWDDPAMRWRRRFPEGFRWLLVFGEQLRPVFKGSAGRVRLGYIDPNSINAVNLDADNAEVVQSISVRETAGIGGQTYKAVRWHDDMQRRDGEAVYWAYGRPPNASRGTSFLLAELDWLAALDTFMLSTVDRVQLQNFLVYDVLVRGANAKQLKEFLRKLPKTRPGMIRAHNERVEWKVLKPELEGADTQQISRVLKGYIGLGAGIPPHWLSEPGDSNRATASDASVPVVKGFKALQGWARGHVEEMIEFVLDEGAAAGLIGEASDRSFDVMLPTIWAADTDRVSAALQSLALSLGEAVAQGWIPQRKAGAVFNLVLGQLGMPSDTQADDEVAAPDDLGEMEQALARQAMAMAGIGATNGAAEA